MTLHLRRKGDHVNFCQQPDGTYVACYARHMISTQGSSAAGHPPAGTPRGLPLGGTSVNDLMKVAALAMQLGADWETPPDDVPDELIEHYAEINAGLAVAVRAAGRAIQALIAGSLSDPSESPPRPEEPHA